MASESESKQPVAGAGVGVPPPTPEPDENVVVETEAPPDAATPVAARPGEAKGESRESKTSERTRALVLLVGGAVAAVEPAVNTVAFFFHEKFWKKIEAAQAIAVTAPSPQDLSNICA